MQSDRSTMAETKSPHSGHRKRFRERYIAHGLDNFQDHEVLELLLYYCFPRGDINLLAHRILDYFGGNLQAVFDAPYEELLKIDGVGERTAVLISMLPHIFRRYKEAAQKAVVLPDTKAAGKYFIAKFTGKRNEAMMVLCMDSSCKVLNCQVIAEGTVGAASIRIRKIVEIVMKFNAFSVIIAHNHPGGAASPSREDIVLTQNIYKTLKALDIELSDHIIVAEDSYLSMADKGMLRGFL